MLPTINQIVEISLDNGEKFDYKSRIADITDDFLGIEIPIEKDTGKMKLLSNGMEIKVFYLGDNKGQYSFDTRVKGRKKDQIPIILLEIPTDFQRLQRRNYLRVPAYLEVSYKVTDEENNNEWNVVKTVDISGGGMKFTVPSSNTIKFDQIINGFIVIPFTNGVIEHINFIGRVVRVHTSRENPDNNLVSIEFISINEIMRAKIIRYCFEKQVKLKDKYKI